MLALEILSAIFGVLCVGLLVYRSFWSWPAGLVQVLLTGIVLWDAKLYAETGLQIVFAVMQVYGWWAWLSSRRANGDSSPGNSPVRVERLSAPGWLWSSAATVGGTAVMAWLLIQFTDGKSPVLDAFITASSLVAQSLLSARYLENWTYWIVVDIVSIPLYVYRELYPLAVLYVVFLGLAIGGWWSWHQAFQRQSVAPGVAA